MCSRDVAHEFDHYNGNSSLDHHFRLYRLQSKEKEVSRKFRAFSAPKSTLGEIVCGIFSWTGEFFLFLKVVTRYFLLSLHWSSFETEPPPFSPLNKRSCLFTELLPPQRPRREYQKIIYFSFFNCFILTFFRLRVEIDQLTELFDNMASRKKVFRLTPFLIRASHALIAHSCRSPARSSSHKAYSWISKAG